MIRLKILRYKMVMNILIKVSFLHLRKTVEREAQSKVSEGTMWIGYQDVLILTDGDKLMEPVIY